MREFDRSCAQGDVFIRRVDSIPTNAKKGGVENKKNGIPYIVITHSETGHDHVMMVDREDEPAVEIFNSTDNPLISWLRVNRPTALEHKRSYDTHEPILFKEGLYEVRRQREYVPEGYRQVQD